MRSTSLPAIVSASVCFLSVSLFGSFSAQAGWQENGVPVAPMATGTQTFPMICTDAMGGVYITWKQGQDAYVQRLTADGGVASGWPLTGHVLWPVPSSQYVSNLAPDMHGGAYVVSAGTEGSGTYRYRLIRYLSDGSIASGWPAEGLLLPAFTTTGRMDGVCGDGEGGVYVLWTTSDRRVLMIRYRGDGQLADGWSGPRFLISEVSIQGRAFVIPSAEGGLLACWGDSRGAGPGPDLGGTRFALKILPTGDPDPAWPAGGVQVNSLESTQENIFIISDGAGGAYIGWNDNRNGVFPPIQTDYEIYGQHVLANGTIDPRWPADGLPIVIAASAQYFFEMAEDGQGGAIFVWDDYRNGAQIYAVRIRPDGSVAPGWTPNGSPMAPRPAAQTIPDAVGDGTGGVYAFWDQDQNNASAVIGQHWGGTGSPAPGWAFDGRVIAGEPAATYDIPRSTSDGAGGAIVAFERSLSNVRRIYAQRVRVDGPVPIALSFLDSEVEPGLVRLRWSASDAAAARATVYRRQGDEPWLARGLATSESPSVLTFEDRVPAAAAYSYRLGYEDGGAGERFTESVTIEVPAEFSLALAGFEPNPARGPLSVAFTMPRDGDARLVVLDVRGRVVAARDLRGLAPGRHRVDLGGAVRVPPGVYWVRLESGGDVRRARGVVLG